MKFDIEFDRTYPHAIDKVWRALTEPAALGTWLMKTDFVPKPGHSFRMWCEDEHGGTDRYLCSVLELDPPHRMAWSWVLEGMDDEGETYVEFRLRKVAEGTHLTIRHSGDRDPQTIERFKTGWPTKLRMLEDTLRLDADP